MGKNQKDKKEGKQEGVQPVRELHQCKELPDAGLCPFIYGMPASEPGIYDLRPDV